MKNTYISIAFGIIIALFSIVPGFSSAQSFEPVSRTYYPEGNTQAIDIINNNYNTNINDNVAPVAIAPTPVPIAYAAPVSIYGGTNVHNIAQGGLPTLTVAPKDKKCATCGHTSYRMVKQLNCGATVAIANTRVSKPTCSLVPALTATGAIQLQWTTAGATVAFIDGGIGHVNTVSGKRIITPSKDTAYNLTVLNDAGIAGTCGAKVNVSLTSAGTVNVIATNSNYSYALNGNSQSASVSNTTITTGTTQNTALNTSTIGTDINGSGTTNTDTSIDGAEDTSTTSTFFGDTFKKIAIPVGIVFLILIVLLMFIMSKVKGAK